MTTTPAVERLTDGWEPETSHADSLCRTLVHHWAEQNAAIAAAAGGIVARNDRFVLADHRHETGFFNAVVLLAPPRDWGTLLDELAAYLAGGVAEAIGFVPIVRFTLWFHS
jgi:hypothetical protein